MVTGELEGSPSREGQSTASDSDRRIALVHPWVVQLRGGEAAFFEMARAIPEADIFFLHYRPESIPADLRDRVAGASFLQHRALRSLPYRTLLALLPKAVDSLDLSDYDLIVSSSFGWTHGARPAPHGKHISYMHSPPRYVWGETPPDAIARRLWPVLRPLISRLRAWDRAAADNVSHFIANSRITAQRIEDCYERSAEIIHPPVDTDRFRHIQSDRAGHLLAVGEQVPYKRFDLAVTAAVRAGRRLVLVGDGTDRARLQRLAEGGDVHFAGRVSDDELLKLMNGASALIHPGIEDFGIVMVEALAAGIPVIGASEGGAADIVVPGTGLLVDRLDEDAYTEAVLALPALEPDRAALQHRAASFNKAHFRSALAESIAEHTG